MLLETVHSGEKILKCTLCSAKMHSNDKTTISDHLLSKKHKNNLRSFQEPEITEKAESISDLKKLLDDELQRNSTLTDYLTICKLIMNNVQDSVQPCSKSAFSSHFKGTFFQKLLMFFVKQQACQKDKYFPSLKLQI